MKSYGMLVAVALVCVAPAVLAGSLTPTGPPGPTMKPLSEVEPRTPISSLPYTISQFGSYYLTQNLGLATLNTNGINVTVGNVTIDLNGFSLYGPGKTAGSTGNGIEISGAGTGNAIVRNGIIANWRESGVRHVSDMSLFENLQCHDNGMYGVYAGSYSIVRGCVCVSNGYKGIYASSNSAVTGNVCKDNTNQGIETSTDCIITGNVCNGNSSYGIGGTTTHRCLIKDNVCNNNGSSGITATGSSKVIGNVCHYNTTHGISLGYDMLVVDNSCDSNGDTGIRMTSNDSCIERNLVTDNVTGIGGTSNGNFVASNRAAGNTTANYTLGTNTVGTGDDTNIEF